MANEQKFYDLTELSTEQPDLYLHVFSATGNFKVSYNNLLDLIRSMRTPKIVCAKRVNTSPIGIALSDDVIAVCNTGSNNVSLISKVDLSIINTITVTGCYAVAYVPALKEFWVTGHASNIYRINALTHVTSTLSCPNSKGIAVNITTNDIYIGSSGTIYKSVSGGAVTDLAISVGGQNIWHLCCTSDGNVWFNGEVGAFGNLKDGTLPLSSISSAITELNSNYLLLSEKTAPVRIYTRGTGILKEIPTSNPTNATSVVSPSTLKAVLTKSGKYITARRLSSNLGRSFLQIIDTEDNFKQHLIDVGIGSIGDMVYDETSHQLYMTDYYNNSIIQIDLTGF